MTRPRSRHPSSSSSKPGSKSRSRPRRARCRNATSACSRAGRASSLYVAGQARMGSKLTRCKGSTRRCRQTACGHDQDGHIPTSRLVDVAGLLAQGLRPRLSARRPRQAHEAVHHLGVAAQATGRDMPLIKTGSSSSKAAAAVCHPVQA